MCVVSMMYEHYYEKWQQIPVPNQPFFPLVPASPLIPPQDIQEFYRLLERAREYDRKHHEPECEDAEKRRKVKELAEQLGVAIDFV